eukprot:6468074-Amphidinium_carterae.1
MEWSGKWKCARDRLTAVRQRSWCSVEGGKGGSSEVALEILTRAFPSDVDIGSAVATVECVCLRTSIVAVAKVKWMDRVPSDTVDNGKGCGGMVCMLCGWTGGKALRTAPVSSQVDGGVVDWVVLEVVVEVEGCSACYIAVRTAVLTVGVLTGVDARV